jgi:hypothetical protein
MEVASTGCRPLSPDGNVSRVRNCATFHHSLLTGDCDRPKSRQRETRSRGMAANLRASAFCWTIIRHIMWAKYNAIANADTPMIATTITKAYACFIRTGSSQNLHQGSGSIPLICCPRHGWPSLFGLD